MAPIKVVVNGVFGKTARQVFTSLCAQADIELVGAAARRAKRDTIALPTSSASIPLSHDLENVLVDAQVVVDFTSAEGALSAIRTAARHKVNTVIGSTGLQQAAIDEAVALAAAHDVGIIIAPNFTLGAVLMIHLSKLASRFFDYADLTEKHHESKIDAPSGTALTIAAAAVEGKGGPFTTPEAQKELVPGTRGGTSQGVTIHSARAPGWMAHHELVFGTLGQTLTIRHDSINRESFMPGVMMAIREVVKRPGLTVGLDRIMGYEFLSSVASLPITTSTYVR